MTATFNSMQLNLLQHMLLSIQITPSNIFWGQTAPFAKRHIRGSVCIAKKKTEFKITEFIQHFQTQNSVFSLQATKSISSFGALKKSGVLSLS